MEENKKNLPKYFLPIIIGVFAIILIIVLIMVICMHKEDTEGIKGYAKLLDSENETYTYLYDGDKIKTYTGYSDMSDFYYDVTCVSKKLEENKYFSEDALINKSEKIIVDYGVYDDITQIANGRYYKVEKDNLYGIIDYSGNIIVPVGYEYITVSAVQDEKEYMFVGEKENEKYDYINENGKIMMQSEGKSYSSNISYYNKFNDEYHTLISIGIDGKNRYFDLTTGEEVLKNEENLNFKYNIQIKDKKIIIFNKNMSVKEEIESPNSYSVSADVYYKKYVVLSEKTLEDGKRSGKYTVFDSEYNKIFTSDSEITLVQDENEDIYFVSNSTDYVEIYNKKGLVAKIEDHTYTSSYNEKSKFIVARRISSQKYDVYDFKGNLVLEGVDNYRYSGNTLIITRKDDTSSIDYIFIDKDNEIALESGDNVVSSSYIIVENLTNKAIKVYGLDGKLLIDTINGTKELYTDEYLIIRNESNYSIYNVNNGIKTFEYTLDDFESKDNDLKLIRLKDGYYNYEGIKILDLTKVE